MKQLDAEISLFQILLIGAIFQKEAPLFQVFFDRHQNLVELHRFGDVVIGAVPDTVEGDLDVRLAGQHDDGGIRMAAFDLGQQGGTFHIRQTDIKQDQGDVVPGQQAHQLRPSHGTNHGKSLLLEVDLQRLTNGNLVIDDGNHFVAVKQLVRRDCYEGAQPRIWSSHGYQLSSSVQQNGH